MKNLRIVHFIISLVILNSCQELLFNDEIVIRDIPLEYFHAVEFSGNYDIVFIQDGSNRMVISGKNYVNALTADVIDDTLIVDDNKGLMLNTGRNKIELHFTDLNYICTNSSVNFSAADTLKTDNLLFLISGEINEGEVIIDCNNLIVLNTASSLGHMTFSGRSENCSFCIRYGASVYADSLYCKNAEVTSVTIGNVFINASEYLNVSIMSSGNIHYYGNPAITVTEKRGSGNLIRKK
jgi:hypothetical protein